MGNVGIKNAWNKKDDIFGSAASILITDHRESICSIVNSTKSTRQLGKLSAEEACAIWSKAPEQLLNVPCGEILWCFVYYCFQI